MNDLETKVLDLIGESVDTPDVYDAVGIEEIRSHVNDAIEEVALLTGSLKRVWHIPIKAGAFFYNLPPAGQDRIAWITSIWLYSNKTPLVQTDVHGLQHTDSRWLYSSGTPARYVPIGVGELLICPASAASSDTLEVTGVAIPSRYTEDTDRIKLRDTYAWAAVNRAVSEWWATRGDASSAARYYKEYVGLIGLPQLYPETAERRWEYKGRQP